MREARIWYSRNPNEAMLPGGFESQIILSHEFLREVTSHSIPTDVETAKALSSSPAALDVFMRLSYRCFRAKGPERIPIFGDFGLASQLGRPTKLLPAVGAKHPQGQNERSALPEPGRKTKPP
jgi:hypothetical protein